VIGYTYIYYFLFSAVSPSISGIVSSDPRTAIMISVSPPSDQVEHGAEEHSHGSPYNRCLSLINLLSACSKDLQKLIFTQPTKKFGMFSLIRNFITIFTTEHHQILSSATRILSTHFNAIYFKSI
jgi:hypothetical protein